jgi:hypothetical protein
MAVSSGTVPDDQGHAADSGTGQPRRGRASRRRLSGTRRQSDQSKRYDGACGRRPVRAGSEEGRALAPRAAALWAATRRLSRSFFLRWRSLRHRRVDRDPLPTTRAYRRALAASPKARLSKTSPLGVPRTPFKSLDRADFEAEPGFWHPTRIEALTLRKTAIAGMDRGDRRLVLPRNQISRRCLA